MRYDDFEKGDKVVRIREFNNANPPFVPDKLYTVSNCYTNGNIGLEGYEWRGYPIEWRRGLFELAPTEKVNNPLVSDARMIEL